jgi:nucleotide-binding universal stress UspA family protein
MWLERFPPVEPSALRVVAVAQLPRSTSRPAARKSLRALILDRSRRLCEAARATLLGGWQDLSADVIEGDPHEHLLRAAEEWKAELVVLGRSAGHGRPQSLGSVARLGAYHLDCSVLVVDQAPGSVREIVLGMDGSVSAREAARLLALFGFAPPPRILALGIVDASWRRSLDLEDLPLPLRGALEEMEGEAAAEAEARLARTTAALARRADVEHQVAVGDPSEILLDAAHRRAAGLIAVGHQGLEPVRRLTLGSVAGELLATAPCALLIGRK